MLAFFSPSLMVLPPISTSIPSYLKVRLMVEIRCAYPWPDTSKLQSPAASPLILVQTTWMFLLHHLLPTILAYLVTPMSLSFINMQHSQIAAGLSLLYQQKEEHYQEAKIAKEVEKQVSVSKWLGIDKCNTLCRLSQVPSEATLPPIWCDSAKAKSEDRLGLFKGWVQSELHTMGESYIEYEPRASFVKKLTSVDWIMHNTYSLGAGSLWNAFHFTDSDIDALQKINHAINLV